jgi:uncharacterized integral membrane protein
MHNSLKRKYYFLVAPALLIAIILIICKHYNIMQVTSTYFILNTISPAIFILTAILALAMPIFYRSIFNNRIKDNQELTVEKLLQFESRTLYIIASTPYLVLIAYVLQLPQFYFAGTVLFSLYGLYFYYPSEKRIENEKRIYRVKNNTDNEKK